jgi:5-methylcytosine-specific restriction endonuclease McrA
MSKSNPVEEILMLDIDDIEYNSQRDKLLKGFYNTPEWKELSNRVMQERNLGRCVWCQVKFSYIKWCEPVVDHIQPLRDFPELGLNFENLQVMCGGCNYKKGSAILGEADNIRKNIIKDRLAFLKREKSRGNRDANLDISYLENPVIPDWVNND